MSCITADQLRIILEGTELSNNLNVQYKVSYAVGSDILFISRDHNNSGFSFGLVQLDIGTNPIAQQAYGQILDSAFSMGIIDEATKTKLLLYSGTSRYDLNPNLIGAFQQDQALLNTIFSQSFAHPIIDHFTDVYLEGSLLSKVEKFLTDMNIIWGSASVFDYNNPNYHLAVAAITSIANRSPAHFLDATAYFESHQPQSIDDVHTRFDTYFSDSDWTRLITLGAANFAAADPHYAGVTNTISVGNAVASLNAQDANDVIARFLKFELDSSCVTGVTYTGDTGAASLVGNFSLFSLSGGLLLSSGGFPGNFNSSPSSSVSYGTPGDADLSNTAHVAFPGAGTTHDASVVQFTFENNDSKVNGISFDIMFGSDEYPEWSNTSFVDVAAIYVNGVNVALFNNNPSTPLSVTQKNIAAGNFLDNTHNAYPIQWDGFTHLLTVRAPLKLGDNIIKIGIADTGDTIYDSGLYINNLKLLTDGGTGGGVLNIVNGTSGNDTIVPTLLAEEINLLGGSDIVSGTPAQLNGDVITGFDSNDILTFQGVLFNANNLSVTLGSAILHVDTNNDGTADTIVTLTGSFEGAIFDVFQSNGNTDVTVDHVPVLSADVDLSHPLTEFAGTTNSGSLDFVSGTLSFTDVDLNDTHTASASLNSATWSGGAAVPAATQAALAIAMSDSINLDGTAGTLAWQFGLADKFVDFLAVGETLTAIYDVTVTDNHSASSTKQVTIVFTGTNDSPVVVPGSSVLANSISELPNVTGSSATDSTSGVIAFSDPDLNDRPTATINAAGETVTWQDASHDYTSQLTAAQIALFEAALQINAEAGNTNAGNIDWGYAVVDKNLDFLAVGESLTVTVPVVIDDHHGGTVNQNVVVTINGANDNPIATPDSNGTAKNSTLSVSAANGVLANDTDPDVHDQGHLFVGAVNGSTANVGLAVAGTYGSITLNADGSYFYAANKGSLPAQIVAQDTFSYTVADGHGGTATSTLSIVVSNPGVGYQAGINTTLNGGNGKQVLDGSAGNDILIGGNSPDVLIGGNGDKLTGGNGPDTFLFRPNFGANTITDFDVNNDTIQFDKSLFAFVSAIASHTTDSAAGAVITDAHGDSVTLAGVTSAQLAAHTSDFHLV